MRNTLLLTATFALALATGAAAQETPQHGALFITPMGQPFRASDDQTGVQKWFAQADTDHDGRISLAEFIADADAFLPRADSNRDGTVTSAESTALWRAEAPEVISDDVSYDAPIDPNTTDSSGGGAHHTRQSNGNSPSWGGITNTTSTTNRRRGATGPRPIGAQAFGLLGDIEPIMSCDTNFDRRIEMAEFEQCAGRRFVELDANHDGFFTPDEVHPWLTARAHAER